MPMPMPMKRRSPELERALADLRMAERRTQHWGAEMREKHLDAFRAAVQAARKTETPPRA